MKILIKLLISVLATGIGINTSNSYEARKRSIEVSQEQDRFLGDCLLYGFSVGSEWVPYKHSEGSFYHHEYRYIEANKINHFTTVDEILLRSTYADNIYAFIYRVAVSPVQCRDWGFLGIGSNSDDWYFRSLVTTCYLTSDEVLGNYVPTNATMSGSYSLTIGVNGSSGFSISCGISYNWNELEIVSSSSIALNKYETSYNDNYISNYTAHDSFYYGMFIFSCDNVPVITISHNVLYYGNCWYRHYSPECHVDFENVY